MKIKLYILVLFLLPFFGRAQENLIQNGSFEEIDTLPFRWSQLSLAKPWQAILSTELFSGFQNPSHQFGVPCNIAGCALPLQDSSYAGVGTAKIDRPITEAFYNGEYLTQKMKKKLRSVAKDRFYFQTIQSDT